MARHWTGMPGGNPRPIRTPVEIVRALLDRLLGRDR